MKILVTGADGFIGGYLVEELLGAGHEVVGIDNHSKYGPVTHSFDDSPRYQKVIGDVKDTALMRDLAAGCDVIVAGAAMIGGISYFHEFAYDLLAENERILAATFDAAISAMQVSGLSRVVVISSSMVYENTDVFPTPEGQVRVAPPPTSTYGFQKLASEYFAKGAWEQYRLPYTIVRPFNCVGIGERRALAHGNRELALSHVLPDLVLKLANGQDPLHILGDGNQVRCFTYGGDLARGIRLALESPLAINESFNLSTETPTSILELATMIWDRFRTGPLRYVSDDPYPHDVPYRVPSVAKAKEMLNWEATTPLSAVLDEVIPWIMGDVL